MMSKHIDRSKLQAMATELKADQDAHLGDAKHDTAGHHSCNCF